MVTYTLSLALPGRTVNGHCVRPSRANDKNRRCTRLVAVPARVVRAGNAGVNHAVFGGSIGGRKLGPGMYQLTVTPNGGAQRTTTFTILA